jgi:hypothetical protein
MHAKSLIYAVVALGLSFQAQSQEPPKVAEGRHATCGLKGTADERIRECSNVFPNMTPKIRSDDRTGDQFIWWLFARTENGKEIWYNGYSKMLWSDATKPGLQREVAEQCQSLEESLESKGFWKYSWRLPTKEEVESAEDQKFFQISSRHVRSFGGYLSYKAGFWTNDLVTTNRHGSPYYLYYYFNDYYYQGQLYPIQFQTGDQANPSHWTGEFLPGLCVFKFKAK